MRLAINATETAPIKATMAVAATVLPGLKPVSGSPGVVTAVALKISELEVPPPGSGLTTFTADWLVITTSEEGITAINWVELTKVVGRLIPLNLTMDPATKLLPLTVKVKAALPAIIEAGDMLEMAGKGLFPVTVRVVLPEVPPPVPGLVTATLNVPAVAKSDAVSETFNWLLETKVVGLGEPLMVTCEVLSKLVPFTVMVEAVLPMGIDEDEMPVTVGTAAMATIGIMPAKSNVATAVDAIFLKFVVFIRVFFIINNYLR